VTVEMSRFEAELLIAMLEFAEGAAPILQPNLVEAMRALRPLRSAMLGAYLRHVQDAPEMQAHSGNSIERQSKVSGDAE
jgi:hypothetical protein